MMKVLFPAFIIMFFIISCNNNEKQAEQIKDNKISLHADTINVVKITDTMVIYESTCRGCAYEQSTHFDISDSLGIVKLFAVHTTDNNSPDMAGGNVSKDLVIVPVKTGTTTIKLYKFWKQEETAKDSANPVLYTIEVRN